VYFNALSSWSSVTQSWFRYTAIFQQDVIKVPNEAFCLFGKTYVKLADTTQSTVRTAAKRSANFMMSEVRCSEDLREELWECANRACRVFKYSSLSLCLKSILVIIFF
jgi:hypothetical protein